MKNENSSNTNLDFFDRDQNSLRFALNANVSPEGQKQIAEIAANLKIEIERIIAAHPGNEVILNSRLYLDEKTEALARKYYSENSHN